MGKFVAIPNRDKSKRVKNKKIILSNKVVHRDPKTGHLINRKNSTVRTGAAPISDNPVEKNERDLAEDSHVYLLTADNIVKTFSWLGMKGSTIKQLATEFDFIEMSNAGITKNAINSLAQNMGISRKFISEDILNVSVKTMERKDNRTRLDKKISSHAIEIAKVVQHAWTVFKDEEKVKRWLNRENRALNNKKPVELLDTLSGILIVDDVLGRIEEGIYS
ncbi:MAG TPA: antitoxin Xre/MbcA/ParS toxin-binding domain-containing protein [Chitinophagaceae bacterium]